MFNQPPTAFADAWRPNNNEEVIVMVRLIVCFVRREDISIEEFQAYWRSAEHHEKIASLRDLFAPDRYTDTLAVALPDVEARFRSKLGRGTQYDAVLEFFWDDESIIRERLTDKAVDQILRVLRDQSIKRVDPEKSGVFFTHMPEVIANPKKLVQQKEVGEGPGRKAGEDVVAPASADPT